MDDWPYTCGGLHLPDNFPWYTDECWESVKLRLHYQAEDTHNYFDILWEVTPWEIPNAEWARTKMVMVGMARTYLYGESGYV
jgi:hypothetical protein